MSNIALTIKYSFSVVYSGKKVRLERKKKFIRESLSFRRYEKYAALRYKDNEMPSNTIIYSYKSRGNQ